MVYIFLFTIPLVVTISILFWVIRCLTRDSAPEEEMAKYYLENIGDQNQAQIDIKLEEESFWVSGALAIDERASRKLNRLGVTRYDLAKAVIRMARINKA